MLGRQKTIEDMGGAELRGIIRGFSSMSENMQLLLSHRYWHRQLTVAFIQQGHDIDAAITKAQEGLEKLHQHDVLMALRAEEERHKRIAEAKAAEEAAKKAAEEKDAADQAEAQAAETPAAEASPEPVPVEDAAPTDPLEGAPAGNA